MAGIAILAKKQSSTEQPNSIQEYKRVKGLSGFQQSFSVDETKLMTG